MEALSLILDLDIFDEHAQTWEDWGSGYMNKKRGYIQSIGRVRLTNAWILREKEMDIGDTHGY